MEPMIIIYLPLLKAIQKCQICALVQSMSKLDQKLNNSANIVTASPSGCTCPGSVPPRDPYWSPPWEVLGKPIVDKIGNIHEVQNGGGEVEGIEGKVGGGSQNTPQTPRWNALVQVAYTASGSGKDEENNHETHEKLFGGLGQGQGGQPLRCVLDRYQQQEGNNYGDNTHNQMDVDLNPDVDQRRDPGRYTPPKKNDSDFLLNSADLHGLSDIIDNQIDVEPSIDSAKGDEEMHPIEQDCGDFHEGGEMIDEVEVDQIEVKQQDRRIRRVLRQSSVINSSNSSLGTQAAQNRIRALEQQINSLIEENQQLQMQKQESSIEEIRKQFELLSQMKEDNEMQVRRYATLITCLQQNINVLKGFLQPAYNFVSYCQKSYPLPNNNKLSMFLEQLQLALINASSTGPDEDIARYEATVLLRAQQAQRLQQFQSTVNQPQTYVQPQGQAQVQCTIGATSSPIEIPLFVNELTNNFEGVTKVKNQTLETSQPQEDVPPLAGQPIAQGEVDIPNEIAGVKTFTVQTDDLDKLPNLSFVNSLSEYDSFFGNLNDKNKHGEKTAVQEARHRSVRNNTSFSQVSPLETAVTNKRKSTGAGGRGEGDGEGEVVQKHYPISKKVCMVQSLNEQADQGHGGQGQGYDDEGCGYKTRDEAKNGCCKKVQTGFGCIPFVNNLNSMINAQNQSTIQITGSLGLVQDEQT
eukprot:TRINITY_DN69859_c0_g1_i5.p1 TRINITY_DN69859_c0_g1~~TRINITY_DN69859_c0_g1_i5.p1  ORF type:complete len:692 (-),score=137.17 TRINITY_DN69859_c0_g1_i5:448-2523(-)